MFLRTQKKQSQAFSPAGAAHSTLQKRGVPQGNTIQVLQQLFDVLGIYHGMHNTRSWWTQSQSAATAYAGSPPEGLSFTFG